MDCGDKIYRSGILNFVEMLLQTHIVVGIIYIFGGASAVEKGLRDVTPDIDLWVDTEETEKAVSDLFSLPDILPATSLEKWYGEAYYEVDVVDIEKVFLPLPSGWQSRSEIIKCSGKLEVRHLDFYSQVLMKISREKFRQKDLDDIAGLVCTGVVQLEKLESAYSEVLSRPVATVKVKKGVLRLQARFKKVLDLVNDR